MPEPSAARWYEAFGRGGPIGIVLVHEIFGYNPFIRSVASELAQKGIPTAAVDLYGGRVAQNLEGAIAMRGALTDAHVLGVLDRARAEVASRLDPAGRVGTLGFSLGGGYALLGACKLPFEFCVDYYGQIPHSDEVRGLRGPVLLILASEDERVTPWAISELLPALYKAKRRFEVHLYPGVRHAFHRPGWEGYDARAAADAWGRTREFLSRIPAEPAHAPPQAGAEGAAASASPALSSGPPTRSHP